MSERVRERYGIALEGASIQATERQDNRIDVRAYVNANAAVAMVTMTPAEARRFASMLIVLAHRSEGGEE